MRKAAKFGVTEEQKHPMLALKQSHIAKPNCEWLMESFLQLSVPSLIQISRYHREYIFPVSERTIPCVLDVLYILVATDVVWNIYG